MKNFWVRTASAAVYAVLFLGSIYSGRLLGSPVAGTFFLTAFALFVAIGCTFEFFRIVGMQGATPSRWLGYLMVAYITVCLSVLEIPVPDFPRAVLLGIAFLGMLVATPSVLALQLWKHSERPFADAVYTLLPVLYIAVPMGLMTMLHNSSNVLVMCIIMVWVNDCFAYMGGSLFGKHKMWPRHSPGKTWEGTAIGVVFAVLVGIFVGPLFKTGLLSYDWVVLALICGIVGTLGDLTESMLKRSVGLKDSGNIMPGHGGFLDRFDSLLFILPFVAAYCLFVESRGF